MLSSGVKPRYDGKGDAWAAEHRDGLGRTFNMHDLDAVVGVVAFAQNTGERLFLEYVPDNYVNKTRRVRQFATVALFDRKSSLDYALSERNALSMAVYLHQCRVIATQQPVAPKFFLVIGGQQPPWTMHEVDINSGELTGSSASVNGNDWMLVWRSLGLLELREQLRKWIDPQTGVRS